MIRWYRYVRHHKIAEYEARGWIVCADLGPTHGQWSVMMEWTGPDEPPTEERM